jgi:hypothetical protein
MVIRGRNIVVIILMLILLGSLAGISLNMNHTSDPKFKTSITAHDSYIHHLEKAKAPKPPIPAAEASAGSVGSDAYEYKLQTARERSRKLEELNSRLTLENLAAEEKKVISHDIAVISEAGNKEKAVEDMLISKGYKNVLAVIDETKVKVYFGCELKTTEVINIGDEIARQLNISLDKIVLVQRPSIHTAMKD